MGVIVTAVGVTCSFFGMTLGCERGSPTSTSESTQDPRQSIGAQPSPSLQWSSEEGSLGDSIEVVIHESAPALRFICVPAGSFEMGRPSPSISEQVGVAIGMLDYQGSDIRNSPVTRVTITQRFWMSERNIMVNEYVAFLNHTLMHSSRPATELYERYVTDRVDNRPSAELLPQIELSSEGFFVPTQGAEDCVVVDATFPGAVAFASWLEKSIEEFSAEVSLPTETEWEYAARGPASRPYPWGHNKPTTGNMDKFIYYPAIPQYGKWFWCSRPLQRPDGATPTGIADMMGMQEWVLDYFTERLSGGSLTDPKPTPLADAYFYDDGGSRRPLRSTRGVALSNPYAANRWKAFDDEGAEIRLILRYE